jgi:hypothetical protein
MDGGFVLLLPPLPLVFLHYNMATQSDILGFLVLEKESVADRVAACCWGECEKYDHAPPTLLTFAGVFVWRVKIPTLGEAGATSVDKGACSLSTTPLSLLDVPYFHTPVFF